MKLINTPMPKNSYTIVEIQALLATFRPITLEQMSEVALMDRVETKYVIPIQIVEQLLRNVSTQYDVFEINHTRISRYKTVYFDTPELQMYHHHHAGKLNRFKIRSREYVETGIAFVEVKKKNNKGRTAKTRIATEQLVESLQSAEELPLTSPYTIDQLQPILCNKYRRITLVSKTTQERVTIDLALTFSNLNGKEKDLSQLAIIEVKQASHKQPSPIKQELETHRLKAHSFSKYCMGVVSLYPTIKHNNFKRHLRMINRLSHGGIS